MNRQERAIMYAFMAWNTDNYNHPVITGIAEETMLVKLTRGPFAKTTVLLNTEGLLDAWKAEVHAHYGTDAADKRKPARNKTWREYLKRMSLAEVTSEFEHVYHHVFLRYISEGLGE